MILVQEYNSNQYNLYLMILYHCNTSQYLPYMQQDTLQMKQNTLLIHFHAIQAVIGMYNSMVPLDYNLHMYKINSMFHYYMFSFPIHKLNQMVLNLFDMLIRFHHLLLSHHSKVKYNLKVHKNFHFVCIRYYKTSYMVLDYSNRFHSM